MSEHVNEFYEYFESGTQKLQKAMPDVLKGFGSLFQSVMKNGHLSEKEKELIAIGISVSVRCEPCIYLHVKKCLSAKATREEILEAASVAVMMQGGPSYTYMHKVIDALEANGETG